MENIIAVDCNGIKHAVIVDYKSEVNSYRWRIDKYGYVYRKTHGMRKYLHHSVCGMAPSGFVVDHMDRNKLNNQKTNLRHIPRSASQQNVGPYRRNASGLRGAHFDKNSGKWKAEVRLDGKLHALGYYSKAAEAAEAAKAFRLIHLPFSID